MSLEVSDGVGVCLGGGRLIDWRESAFTSFSRK